MANLQRRRFLQRMGLSMASGFFLAPLLSRLTSDASAQGSGPKRLVVVNSGHGFEDFKLPATSVRSPSDFTLPPSLAPFEPHLSRLTIVEGLFNTNSDDLHGSGASYYTCVPRGEAASIEQVVAERIPLAPRGERSVHLGMNGEPFLVEGHIARGQGAVFSRAGGARITPYENPIEAVKTLFGAVTGPSSTTPDTSREDRRLFLLSTVSDDIKRARVRLPASEREKLDVYLDSIEQMETRLKALKTMPLPSSRGCEVPRLGQVATGTERVRYAGDNLQGAYNHTYVLRDAYADVATNVLACGISNVVTIELFSGGNTLFLEDVLEDEDPEMFNQTLPRNQITSTHDIYHGTLKSEAYMSALPPDAHPALKARLRLRYHRIAMGMVARILEHLSSIPEAGGTMLDHTLVVWGSDCGGNHHGGQSDINVFLFGNVSGSLPGRRYLRYPRNAQPQNDFWVTLANLMGVPIARFGEGGTDPSRGPLSLV